MEIFYLDKRVFNDLLSQEPNDVAWMRYSEIPLHITTRTALIVFTAVKLVTPAIIKDGY